MPSRNKIVMESFYTLTYENNIESAVTTKGIEIDPQVRFSGYYNNRLPQSDNYSANSNFDVSLKTTTGGIDIDAKYTP